MLGKKAKEVLQVLNEAGLLEHIVLIGSWCGHFYSLYFGRNRYRPNIQTLDIDFLIPEPRRLQSGLSPVQDLLKPLDFDEEYTASGWLRFVHPELRVEFLVPRLGPQSDDPRKIPQLKITAMPLRHTSVLTKHTIEVEDGALKVRVPHPVAFALHKLFVSGRRKDKEKAGRDLEMALRILETLRNSREIKDIFRIWTDFTQKEKNAIQKILVQEGYGNLINM